MDDERSKQLGKIIVLSRDMLVLAKENEWQRVAELDGQRRALVMQCFQFTTPDQDAPAVAAAIREILSLNQQVANLGAQQQATVSGHIRTQQLGRTARQAYSRCAR